MSSTEMDIVVIGGGVTGCGVALDAASRGLDVALVEQRDYASGTSSRSSKLFHGGLRYLEQKNFSLVKEALAERNLMLNHICPHLVSPVRFLYPLQRGFLERIYVGAGVLLYDVMGRMASSPLPGHRHLTKSTTRALAPGLDPSSFTGAISYWDGRVDDARHTLAVARTAAAHGALLASSTRVTGLIERGNRIRGVLARDLESGREITIHARCVISATGVWTDDIQTLAGDEGLDIEVSKGIHVVVPRESIRTEPGLILRTGQSVLFVIPWGRFWIVGTTDTPWGLRRAHPAASRADIEYLLTTVNAVLSEALTHDDIVGVYAGLRPLLKGESDSTSNLSREHAIMISPNGLVAVAGGKYTTYRIMARDAVDAAVQMLPATVPKSLTHRLRLTGETREAELDALMADRPDLGRHLGDTRFRRAEAIYGATHEGALHLDDLLTRRTRVSIETRDRGVALAEETAALMGPELGWSAETVKREVEHYVARVNAELDSQTRADDETADAARMGARDVRRGGAD